MMDRLGNSQANNERLLLALEALANEIGESVPNSTDFENTMLMWVKGKNKPLYEEYMNKLKEAA